MMKAQITTIILVLISFLSFTQSDDISFYEDQLGITYYDIQTQRTMQNRFFVYDDGTMGAVWNMGEQYPAFADLGVGYNYFDGSMWGPLPYESITSAWAINPSYTNYGESGELCVSQGQNGLYINSRAEKGTGAWQESIFGGPGLKHPVVVTTGADDHVVHLLYLKADETFVPTAAQPSRGFLWYARSSDGMISWDINQQVDGIGQDDYLGFTVGSYSWAEPKDDVLAFLVGDYLTDLVLIKSDDGGDNWQKSLIWEHPYPMFEIFTFESDSFYCNGGSMSVVLDDDDMAHVAFGLSKVYSPVDQDTLWYNPYADGIVYWREDMPPFKNTLNSLNPDSLSLCENLIGWSPDVNANGSNDILPPPKYPMLGLSSMPILTINENGQIFLVYSSVTEGYNTVDENYRHLWMRVGVVEQCFWSDQLIDLTSDLIHIFDECVFPSVAPRIDDNLYLIYQFDSQPGPAIGGGSQFWENNINFMEVPLGWEQKSTKGVYVNFRISSDSIFEGDTVHFQNLACGCPFPTSNTWYFEGGYPSSSTNLNPDIVYNTAGTYDVELNISNGQTNGVVIKEDFITVFPYTNTNEYESEKEIVVFPNPSTGEVMILGLDQLNPDNITITNILGQEMFSVKWKNDSDFILNLDAFPEGFYFIIIKAGESTMIKKLTLSR